MHDNQILQQLLEQEIALLEELNGLSLLKKDALLKDDLDALETIVLKEEALSAKLKTVNNACLPQVQFFLRGEKKSDRLTELAGRLKKKALELRRNNELNQAMLKDSINLLQFAINCFMVPVNAQSAVYGASGRLIHFSKKTVHLDTKG